MIESYSKINLFLKILKKKNNGLHNLQSSVMLLDLYDLISVKIIKKKQDEIKFIGRFKKKINYKSNSITKSLYILRKNRLISKKKKYKIIINKKIPVFAGLGGGTSNAASLIKYFLKNNINERLMKIFEAEIGSDFRLFFYRHSFQKNLKKIIKFKKRYTFNFMLIYPNINCSTKKVYSKVKKFSLPLKNDLSKIRSKRKYLQFLQSEINDLQSIVEKKYPKIKKILNLLKIQKNCLFSRMTGSGSVCFGVFPNKNSAKLSMRALKKKFPDYCYIIAKSI
ncbi:MAG: 4-(cytidine 5'-diphospho)-2-C-methyl-D-erythritol kinase [Pelagibacteraceae bacterium]|jgi:4-diphosphocytidyl-2-C-methyl-D-erythritol kinase|nr:4-(cytidine 5'-diphospho)-2-C-methyl-D-erythritol kinase [Pelagibacteraceae bacterium]